MKKQKVKDMTLEDYIACSVTGIQYNAKPEIASLLMDSPMPETDDDAKGWFDFWMKWEAFRKYKYARAMIEERNK